MENNNLSLFVLVIALFMFIFTTPSQGQPPFEVPPSGGLPICTLDLNTCNMELEECEAETIRMLPGDGYPNPDTLGVSGHGPALNYLVNGDGTFTDINTGLMWEIKDTSGSGIHDENRTFTWTSSNNELPDGTLFTLFIDSLNNTCNGDGTIQCLSDGDCGAGLCGFAGYQDWRVPNIKELQSLVNYSVISPSYSGPGPVNSGAYWSSTTNIGNNTTAWMLEYQQGVASFEFKGNGQRARAVRP